MFVDYESELTQRIDDLSLKLVEEAEFAASYGYLKTLSPAEIGIALELYGNTMKILSLLETYNKLSGNMVKEDEDACRWLARRIHEDLAGIISKASEANFK
jgi:hypothetical protein